MTENKREEILKDIREGYIDAWDNSTIDELFETIEKEHNEIQQYRAIGTVEELRVLKRGSIPQNPDRRYKTQYMWDGGYCPVCGCGVTARWNYCQACGQRLDWE